MEPSVALNPRDPKGEKIANAGDLMSKNAPRLSQVVSTFGPSGRASRSPQSSGSTLTSAWAWSLPTQNVTGVVELSRYTVRMLVSLGMRYSTVVAALGSTRTTRSLLMPPVQISPFLSTCAR